MTDYNTYRIQTILGLIQAGIIMFGTMLTGVTLKIMGHSDHIERLPFELRFIRNWGFLLIVIPLIWAANTIWMERSQAWYTKRFTMISGLCLAALLVVFMAALVGRAGSSLISIAQ